MADPLDLYGDALRRALHCEADAVVPAPDGLDRIRARVPAPTFHPTDLLAAIGLLVILLLTLRGS